MKKPACQICTDKFNADELKFNEAEHGINVCPDCAAPAQEDAVKEEIKRLVGKGTDKKVAKTQAEAKNLDKKVIAKLIAVIESDNTGKDNVAVEEDDGKAGKGAKAATPAAAKPAKAGSVEKMKAQLKTLRAERKELKDEEPEDNADEIKALNKKVNALKAKIEEAEGGAPAPATPEKVSGKAPKAEKVSSGGGNVAKMTKQLADWREERSESDDKAEKKTLTDKINAIKIKIREAKAGGAATPAKAEKVASSKAPKATKTPATAEATELTFEFDTAPMNKIFRNAIKAALAAPAMTKKGANKPELLSTLANAELDSVIAERLMKLFKASAKEAGLVTVFHKMVKAAAAEL